VSRTSATYAGGRATGSLAMSAALNPSVERPNPSRGRRREAAFPSSLWWETMKSSTGSTSESGSSSRRRWAFSRVVMPQRVALDFAEPPRGPSGSPRLEFAARSLPASCCIRQPRLGTSRV